MKDPRRPRVQPDAKGSSVQDREVLCGRNGPSRQARINQGEVAHTDDDCAEMQEIQWKSVRLQELMESVCVKARRMFAKEGVVTL